MCGGGWKLGGGGLLGLKFGGGNGVLFGKLVGGGKLLGNLGGGVEKGLVMFWWIDWWLYILLWFIGKLGVLGVLGKLGKLGGVLVLILVVGFYENS